MNCSIIVEKCCRIRLDSAWSCRKHVNIIITHTRSFSEQIQILNRWCSDGDYAHLTEDRLKQIILFIKSFLLLQTLMDTRSPHVAFVFRLKFLRTYQWDYGVSVLTWAWGGWVLKRNSMERWKRWNHFLTVAFIYECDVNSNEY